MSVLAGNLSSAVYRHSGMKNLAIIVVLSLAAAACGGASDTSSPTTQAPSSWDRNPATPLVIVENFGGFLPVEVALGQMPEIVVYGDGAVVTQGPVIAIFPGPALPNLVAGQFDDGAMQAILDKAASSGVLSPLDDYGTASVADAGTTRITVTVGGETRTGEIYALGLGSFGGEQSGFTAEQATARQGALAFIDFLRELADGAPSAEYEVTAYAVFPWPFGGVPTESPVLDWPFAPLAELGSVEGFGTCVTIEGKDADQLQDLLGQATTRTPWTSEGVAYGLVFRPLLRHESSCDELR